MMQERPPQDRHDGDMPLHTAFTDLLSVEHPVVLAPMAGSAGGSLAAAVSNGGGLGMIGGGGGAVDWCTRQLDIAARETDQPWGIGFLTWSLERPALDLALGYQPKAVMLSFGDPAPFAGDIRAAGAALIVQVTDLDEARQAFDAGADIVVAQGSESGGHGGSPGRATLPFVPAVVDMAGATPVLGAGGIADGRGLAAVLALGAAGALLGTRFQATPEALVDPRVVEAILAGHGHDTERTRVLDVARGAPWPDRYPGRALRNAFIEQWRGREDALHRDEEAKRSYRDAVRRGDMAAVPVWASEAIDLITGLVPAAELVSTLVAEAEQALARATR